MRCNVKAGSRGGMGMDREHLSQSIAGSAETISGLSRQVDRIAEACRMVVGALRAGAKILAAGNGGSAAEALHLAEELTGRFRSNRRPLPGLALVADCTALTCIGNDFGFDKVFSRQVEALGQPGDVLVLFSSSGNSPNLIAALEAARVKGVKVIGLLGKGGGAMAGRGDCEVVVDSSVTSHIQEAHAVLMHILLGAVEAEFGI